MYLKTDGGLTVLKENYTFADFRADFPNVSLAKVEPARTESLAERNIFPVTILSKPAYDENTQAVNLNSSSTWNAAGSRWERGWTVRSLSAQELVGKAKQKFQTEKESARTFDEEEVDILLAGYLEVKLVRLAVLLGQTPANVDTPVINAINAVFPGQTKLQIAQTIENRAQNYLTAAATALANKIKAGG